MIFGGIPFIKCESEGSKNPLAVKLDPSFGAAILAMVGARENIDIDGVLQNISSIGKIIEPIPVIIEKYKHKYQRFLRLFEVTKISQ